MKICFLLLITGWAVLALADDSCDRNVDDDVLKAIVSFQTELYKSVAYLNQNRFVISAYGVYLELAAMGEGATGDAQKEIFTVLRLPEEKCLRNKYYEYIRDAELQLPKLTPFDVYFGTRVLAVDEGYNVNQTWAEDVRKYGLLDFVSLPLKRDPEAAFEKLNHLSFVGRDVKLEGNSLIGAADYRVKWQTEFPHYKIENNAKFYSERGQEIGTVNLMRFKKRVKMAFLEEYFAKVLALPIGEDGRYNMVFLLNIGYDLLEQTVHRMNDDIVKDIIDNLKESKIPIDIAIPEFTAKSSDVSLKSILEGMGVKKLWSEPEASELISNPPAVPTAFYQQVQLHVDSRRGVKPYFEEESEGGDSGFEEYLGDDFIAIRPFLYALIDTKTKICVFSGGYGGPDSKYGHFLPNGPRGF